MTDHFLDNDSRIFVTIEIYYNIRYQFGRQYNDVFITYIMGEHGKTVLRSEEVVGGESRIVGSNGSGGKEGILFPLNIVDAPVAEPDGACVIHLSCDGTARRVVHVCIRGTYTGAARGRDGGAHAGKPPLPPPPLSPGGFGFQGAQNGNVAGRTMTIPYTAVTKVT